MRKTDIPLRMELFISQFMVKCDHVKDPPVSNVPTYWSKRWVSCIKKLNERNKY